MSMTLLSISCFRTTFHTQRTARDKTGRRISSRSRSRSRRRRARSMPANTTTRRRGWTRTAATSSFEAPPPPLPQKQHKQQKQQQQQWDAAPAPSPAASADIPPSPPLHMAADRCDAVSEDIDYVPFPYFRDFTLTQGPFVISPSAVSTSPNNNSNSNPPSRDAFSDHPTTPNSLPTRPPPPDATVSLVVEDMTAGDSSPPPPADVHPCRHFVISCAYADVNRLARLLSPPGSGRRAAVIFPDGKWRPFTDLSRALVPGSGMRLGVTSASPGAPAASGRS